MTRINGCAVAVGALALFLAGCQPALRPEVPATAAAPAPAPAAVATPPAVPSPVPPVVASVRPASPPPPATPPAKTTAATLPSTELPPGPIYFCEVAGVRTPLELPDGVEALCRRHPEMGPCQYERDVCRERGGRVWTSKGEEVTRAVENAYDQRVHRVRLRADGGAAR